MTLPVPTEDNEQAMFVQYLEMRGLIFTAIPNHTYNPHHSQQSKNKRLGLRKGLPDLLVIVNGQVMWFEMKRMKGSSTSPEQKAWITALNEAGTPAFVCKGANAAIDIVEHYLTGRQLKPETVKDATTIF